MESLCPHCLPLFIGSVPWKNPQYAVKLVFQYSPEFPAWPQLCSYKQEGMLYQALSGFPGAKEDQGRIFVDHEAATFAGELFNFEKEYAVHTQQEFDTSHFVLTPEVAAGFFACLDYCREQQPEKMRALKGQIVGPITLVRCTTDKNGRSIAGNKQLRDAAVKMLRCKAQYQVREMRACGVPPLLFFDEPGLVNYKTFVQSGCADFDGVAMLSEVFAGIRAEGGLAGVHVCGAAPWSLVFSAQPDIVSYDACCFFDDFIGYGDNIQSFMASGGLLATGLVPTAKQQLDGSSAAALTRMWSRQCQMFEEIGVDRNMVYRQSFITPSCGLGTLPAQRAMTAMRFTSEVSQAIGRLFA